MYINTTNGAEVSVEEMQQYATEAEMSIEEYAAAAGFTLKSDENKTTDFPTSTAADADVVQQKGTASKNTDLPTVDTSSDSSDPLDDYYVTIEDLRQDEEDASPALNIKLAGIGISTKQSTSFGSLDALNFENSTDPKVEGEGAGTKFFNKFIGNPTKIFSAIGIGINKTDEELALAAAEINEYIKLKADTSFLNKAKKRSGDDYEKYADTLKAPELSTEDLESSMKKDLVSEFSKIQRGEVSDDIAGFKKNSGEAIVVGTEQKDATVDQFKNEKEFKAYNQWKKNGYISDFSEDEILLYDDKRKQKYALDASLRYASDLSIDGRMDVLALAANDEKKLNNFQEISSDYFKIEDSLKNAIKEYNLNPTQDKLIAANAIKIDYLQKQGEIQSLQGKLKKDGVFEKGRTIPLALTDLNKDYDYVRQLRTGFKSLAGNVTYAGASLAILAGKLQNPGAIAIELSSPESTSAKIESATGLVSLGDELQKESENFQRSIAVDEIRSVSDAGKWVAGSAVNLVPSLAMAMTGPAAMPLFFLSGMGSKGMEMAVSRKNSSERMIKNKQFLIDNPNADPSILMSLEQEMDEDAKILGIKEWQSLGIQALYGIAEVAMEKVGTMTLLKNLKNATKMLSPTTVKEGFKFLGKGLKEVGKGIRVEGGSEFGTTVAQNFGDIFILGEDKNLFEGGLESFAQGALMGGAMNSVGVAKGIRQGYISVLASRDETIKLRENLNALRKLTNQPKIESWEDLKNLKLKLPKETQSVVDAITLDMQKTEEGVMFKLGSTLSIDQAYKVEEANRKMRLINKQLIDASTNPSIKAAELTQIKSQLSIQFDALAKEREQLLSDSVDIKQTKESFVNANVSLDSTLGYQYYSQVMLNKSIKSIAGNYSNLSPEANQAGLDAAKKDLIKEGKKDPSIKEIKAKAEKSYIDNAYKKKIEAGRSNAEAFAKQQGLDLEIMSFEGKDAKAQIIKAFKNAGVEGKELAKTIKAVKNGSFEGGAIEGTNKIIINMNAAIENKRIGVFAHEVLHKYAKEKYKSNNTQGAIDKAGADLLSYLEKNDKDLFAKVKFRIDTSYTNKNKDGDVVKEADYYEEAMNAMSDVLADGQVVNDKSMNKIRVFANSFLSKLPGKFQFTVDQGRDAYEFVKGYNKAAHFGGVKTPDNPIVKSTDDDEKAITREDKDKKVSLSVSKASLQEELDTIKENESDYDDPGEFDAIVQNLEFKIKAAKKKEAAKPKEKDKTKTKTDSKKNKKPLGDQFDEMVPKGTTKKVYAETIAGKVVEKINKGMLNPLIVKIAAGYGIVKLDNIYGKNLDDFIKDVISAQFIKNIMNYDPLAANKSLGGYIIAGPYGIRNRVKEALIKGKKEAAAGSGVGLDKAKDVTSREELSTQEAEKSKYVPLTKSNIVPSFTIKAITEKLTIIVSKLKSKITDAAGKNNSSPPLIREMKNEIGKVVGDAGAIPKLVIARLGNLKDGSYESNLINHKKAIIENMTTTFLMGKDNGKVVKGGIPIAIEKSVGGAFRLNKDGSREKITVNVGGKNVVQDVFDPKFIPYPEWIGQEIDREKTLVRGATSGNEIVRRVSADKVSDADFVGLFIDEKGKLIKGKREAIGKAIGEEIAFEIFSKEIQNENSEISKAFDTNQEALGEVLADNFVNVLLKDIDRGTVKFSKAAYITGFDALDNKVRNLIKYISVNNINPISIITEGNEVTKDIIEDLEKSYLEFIDKIKNEEYLKGKNLTDRQKNRLKKWNKSSGLSFTNYINNVEDYNFNYVESILGVQHKSSNLKAPGAKQAGKKTISNYYSHLVDNGIPNPQEVFLRTLRGWSVSGLKSSIFGNNKSLQEFITENEVLKNAFAGYTLEKSEKFAGLTIKTASGKKAVNPILIQEVKKDLSKTVDSGTNKVDLDGRKKLANQSAEDLKRFSEFLKNGNAGSNLGKAVILNTMSSSMRSILKTVSEVKGVMAVDGLPAFNKENKSNYTLEHGTPVKQLRDSIAYFISDENLSYKNSVGKVIETSYTYVVPTEVSKAIDVNYRDFFPGQDWVYMEEPFEARFNDEATQELLKAKGYNQTFEDITQLDNKTVIVPKQTKFSKSNLTELSQVDLNKIGLESDSNHGSLLRIQFSKSARKKYENVLRNKRPELKDIPAQVDELFKWADGLKVADNKKSKYKKLALYYTANGYTIFPEDGYKIEEVIRLSEANKVDPYAYKNPDELINKFTKEEKTKKINPDTVKEFSNKRVLSKGVTIYNVDDSRAGQRAVRNVADSNWGKDFNGWCLIHRAGDSKSELDNAWKQWENYNEGGYGYEIAFQNGKLISFRDGNADGAWWDRFDRPTDDLQINLGKKDGLTTRGKIDSQGEVNLVGYGEGDFMSRKDTYKLYDENKELIEAKVYKDGKLSLAVENTPTKMNDGGRAIRSKKSKYIDGELISSVTTVKDLKTGKIVTTTTLSHEKLNENSYIETFTVVGKNGKSPTAPRVTEKTIGLIEKRELGPNKSTEYYAEKITDGVSEVVIDRMVELNSIKESLKSNIKFSKSIGELNLVETGQQAINNARSLAYNNNVKRLDITEKDISELTTNKAKADWLINKIAEGYNDFYFIDNKMNEVKAVKNVLNTFDVKGKVQQAKVKFSKSMNTTFNEMLQRSTGIETGETIERSIARRRGATKGKFKVWMPSSLDDFKGLTSYTFAGKGRQGEADQKFFQDALITPYFRGIRAIEQSRQAFIDDFKTLNKQMRPVLKKLGKIVPGTEFTHDQAIRIALWTASGYDIPGISESDIKTLVDFVNDNADLSEYTRKLQLISKRKKWAKPGDFWDAETIISDLNNLTEKVGRKEYLTEFIENVDIIFSEDNLNKVEAGYGEAQKEALKDIIYRMKNGTNRPSGSKKNENRFNNWVNNSIGAIMFFNRRSALLQTLSIANFINWGDNNVLKAGAAFANQPQYWKDFATLFNSSKLKQRRSGLKSDVNEAEIANAVKGSRNKAVSALSYLLKIGFTPTQLADSFAIASGGATFYRNRINSYLKEVNAEGEKVYTQKQAEEKAFEDFSQISEETQQSGDPALISSDQASTLGRMILAFQNTPIQLNRSIKKAALDIKNRRRTPGQTMLQSDFSNISKIIYYGTVQNIIFSALQNALFALIPGFEDEDDELTEEEQLEKYGKIYSTKQSRIVNGMIDTTLKGGFGVPGAGISMIKNAYLEWEKQKEKGFTGDQGYTILAAVNLSPPVGSKLRKIYSAIKTEEFDKDVIAKRGWDITIDGKFNLSPAYKVLGSVTEGLTNLPLDRMVAEISSITEALDARNSKWQRIALALGWKTWDVNVKNEEHELIKTEAKQQKVENKKAEKANFDVYRRKVFKVLTRSENRKYSGTKGAKLKKEYILKLGKEKGIK